ncbi:MAG: class I SAM-dependent methyltransferase [Flavobacteriales bacterium]|nr:class I SAM-dependent methyltransferase [Flavobacteriales bacterium]
MTKHVLLTPRSSWTLVLIPVCFSLASMAQHHEHGHPHANTVGNVSNQQMHRSSTAELIARFESPERDAYQQPEKVLAYLGDLRGKHIMDIGAGSGYFSVKLAANGAQVIAADVNDEFLAHITERITKEGLKHIEPRKIPFDAPGLNDREVDMVLIVNTYHHIEDRAAYFAKVKVGTKTDGELVVIDFFKTEVPVGPPVDHKVSIDEVIGELKQAGYTTFTVEVALLPYQYIVRAR